MDGQGSCSGISRMILTFKIRHNRDFSVELAKAKKIAEYGMKTKSRSSADVKHIGLKSAIANQILKKYSTDKKAKKVRKVVLTVPNQSIKVDKEQHSIKIPCLKLETEYHFRNDFEKINQVEINEEFMFVSVSIPDEKEIEPDVYLGVDLNTTGHSVVVANPETGKVVKMGKNAHHIHKKYSKIRKDLQKKGKFGRLKRHKKKENRVVKDMNHKISRKVVNMAIQSKSGIKLEDLKGIRNTAKSSRPFRYSLNSWSFYQLQRMIEYKAKLQGIPVVYIEPQYTSQLCSRCGHIGNRNGKDFSCPICNHVDNADVNASFNIANRQEGVYQFDADRDVSEGFNGNPQGAMA